MLHSKEEQTVMQYSSPMEQYSSPMDDWMDGVLCIAKQSEQQMAGGGSPESG